MRSASKRSIANYVGWRVIQNYSIFLPKSIRQPFQKYRSKLAMEENESDRWVYCVSLAVGLLDAPVGKMLVEHSSNMDFAQTKVEKGWNLFKFECLDWADNRVFEDGIHQRVEFVGLDRERNKGEDHQEDNSSDIWSWLSLRYSQRQLDAIQLELYGTGGKLWWTPSNFGSKHQAMSSIQRTGTIQKSSWQGFMVSVSCPSRCSVLYPQFK